MSKGLGYVQRAVSELIESSGAEDISAGQQAGLCEHIYGKSGKSQRGALIRAIKKMKLPAGWKFERGWDEMQLINDERFHARSGQPRAELKPRCTRRGFRLGLTSRSPG